MAARRKRRREKHLINNVVIVVALAAFGFFYWREKSGGGEGAMLRSPNSCLEFFVEKFGAVRGDVMRPDMTRPSPEPGSIKEIDVRAGWLGLDIFFCDEDLGWLRDNANHISWAVAPDPETWKNWKAWEKYIAARNDILSGAPRSKFSTMNTVPPTKEGDASMTIMSTEGTIGIQFRLQDGRWKVRDFFGRRSHWDGLLRQIDAKLPSNLRLY